MYPPTHTRTQFEGLDCRWIIRPRYRVINIIDQVPSDIGRVVERVALMIKETGRKRKNETLKIKISHFLAMGTRVKPIFQENKRI